MEWESAGAQLGSECLRAVWFGFLLFPFASSAAAGACVSFAFAVALARDASWAACVRARRPGTGPVGTTD